MITRGNKQKKILADNTLIEQIQNLSSSRLGMKHSFFRGVNLGTAVTDEQWEEIRNGTFRNMFLGDFWEIGGVTWSIMDFNYWLRVGNWGTLSNNVPQHVVISALQPMQLQIGLQKMNETRTTSGGYANSKIREDIIPNKVLPIIKSAFGEPHLMTHKAYQCNATDASGNQTGGAWFERIVDIPTEMMMYGDRSFSSRIIKNASVTSDGWRQLAYFRSQNKWFPRGVFIWLQEVADAYRFAANSDSGVGSFLNADQGGYIIPIFAIKG